MGLFDYFSKDAATQRKLDGLRKKLSNMFYQKQDRMAAAEVAADMARQGNKEAIQVLLLRFDQKSQNHTIDQDEKGYVVDLLIGLGDPVIEPITTHIKTTSAPVYWALQVLAELWSADKYAAFVAEVLRETDTGYLRDPAKKLGLLQLAETIEHDDMGPAIVPFLDDHTEDVRFKAVDCLVKFDYPQAQEALIGRLASGEEDGMRVVKRLCEAIANKGWPLGDHADAISKNLASGFRVSGGKLVAG